MIRAVDGGVRLEVLVVPRASSNRVLGEHDGRLRIAITAPPVDGAANAALCKAIAAWLRLGRRDVTVASGHSGRRKSINLAGLSLDEVDGWLAQHR